MKAMLLILGIIGSTVTATAQRIEYDFGKNSDVIDSVKFVLEWYKKNYDQPDINKLNIYAGINYCDGTINLSISQYAATDDEMRSLAKKTNRFIKVSDKLLLPVILDTDILSKELSGKRAYIHMGGYYLQIDKNDNHYWKVIHMQVTF